VGDFHFLSEKLPPEHLKLTSNVSPLYLIVWFLIALWTFADPGFHQRCYAAKDGNTAKWGILISVFFMILFDFLTTTTGLYARAVIPGLSNPVLSFPLYAERILGTGSKGIFYAAMFATIISTLNSFIFLSATTFGRDFVFKLKNKRDEIRLAGYTRIGLIFTFVISIIMAFYVQSVISIWYMIGSICIPGIILLVIGAYYEKLSVSRLFALIEMIVGFASSIIWFFIREHFEGSIPGEIEPMLAGLICASLVHVAGMLRKDKNKSEISESSAI
jgi:SSS family solute:Na+ symporter